MKPLLSPFLYRIWRARLSPCFREKVTQMAIDFFAEAAVLVGVLGILDFVITWRQQPTVKVVVWSLGIAIALFIGAVKMQAAGESQLGEALDATKAS